MNGEMKVINMQKIAINAQYGGFSLSYEGVMAYAKQKGIKIYAFMDERYLRKNVDRALDMKEHYIPYNGELDEGEPSFCIHYSTKPIKNGKWPADAYFSDCDIPRDDKDLIAVIKKLGEKADGQCAKLKIVEIPDNVKWVIDEYDGFESVEEAHQSWG